MNFETLNIDSNGPIGHLTLNRPQQLNAMNSTMLRELAEAARWFDTQPEVRVVIVRGAGRAFCAGVDLKDSSRTDADGAWLTLCFTIRVSARFPVCEVWREAETKLLSDQEA
jgi:enoyl-CoA hydratase